MKAKSQRRAEIDLGALQRNVAALRARLPKETSFIAVVKANAYGHGARAVARAALAAGAQMLAVVTLEEAEELRDLVERPELILVLGPAAEAGGFALACTSREQAEALIARGRPATVHLEIDTGMTRYGVDPADAPALARRLVDAGIVLAGTWTHLASADSDSEFTREQLRRFEAALDRFDVPPGLRHAANSAAVLRHPEAAYDAARVGIAMYGCEGGDVVEPVLALRAPITRLTSVAKGTAVGYGGTWRAPRESAIATVGIGYGDGVHRVRSNRGFCLVRGIRAPVVGRISMDSLTLDVTGVPNLACGDLATLIGADGDERISAEEVAAWSETISYEVLTSIGQRVERIYAD